MVNRRAARARYQTTLAASTGASSSYEDVDLFVRLFQQGRRIAPGASTLDPAPDIAMAARMGRW